ncbi:MAG: 4Fe-4S binding protein [Gammaproteobacteria bacterium]|nr:4Fe-4S binding protein [Gammaproteobacteria bacterium]
MELQRIRLWTRSGFFLLFLLAPPLDLFRLDLLKGHFIFFGMNWEFGLAVLTQGELTATATVLKIITLGFLPLVLFVGGGIWISWKYGRLYCGWLCPHFSVVEMINSLMRRASGRPSLWEEKTLPETESDGTIYPQKKLYWGWTGLAIIGFSFLWAVVLLTYLLPPAMIYSNLFTGELTRNQGLFIGVATLLFCLEFLLARHLFCSYGCAVGLFQSLAWMINDRALVVTFDRDRGEACKTCTQACDNTCPMRLQPRKNKRHMFTCTQCTRCIDACEKVQAPSESLLHWRPGDESSKQSPARFK